LRDACLHADEPLGQEREAVVEAGRRDDEIVLGRASVGESDRAAVIGCDVRAGLDATLADVGQHLGAEGGMAVEQVVVGPLQAVLAVIADGDLDDGLENGLLQEQRQVPDRQVGGRLAEHGLGQIPVPRSQADVR
jgi:hypothetical protein